MANAMTAEDIRHLLARRYKKEHWLLAFEVRDRTGYQLSSNSFADAIAMHRWPSHGYVVHGFEIKVSRADWLNEIGNPAKAARFANHVDHWWLVAPANIVEMSEIPDSWGFMRATAKSLRVAKDAPQLSSGRTAAVPMDRGFVASLMRRVGEEDTAWTEALARAEKEIEKRLATRRSFEMEELRARLRAWDHFDERFTETFGSPFRPSFSHPDQLARRLRAAMTLVGALDEDKLRTLERTVNTANQALCDLREMVLNESSSGPHSSGD